ncbi:Alpha/Beta hydrolase protein [Cercophora newfieldiana]|uniref:Alpha/Beta hydrolase protein n=1 Tax=Cercophora newfieldiana TaxID=92897 RepID=A0AA40CRE5_9PEZI|nr:Alpha/Beta hydrolase protein [Cercophora newfieldiana]
MQLILAVLLQFGCLAAAQRPSVSLNHGTYVGTTTQVVLSTSTATVNKFIGVPFAEPPVRFRAPRLPAPSNKTAEALRQPPGCTNDEDCLYLNVFAPQTPGLKAVLVWWHGGALQGGSISGTDGSNLAANEDIVVVASQYRLGVFGFPGNVSGLPADELNAGFRDQKTTLRWIQENIAAFEGDKTKVVIAGESAGGVSVDSQLMSEPFDKPLFHAAILQSGGLHTFNRVALGVGPYVTGLGTGNKKDEPPFLTLAGALNCDVDKALACVQSKTAAEVRAGVSKVNLLFPPVNDGGLSSVGDSDSARRAGRTIKVPVLIGSTFEEGNIFPANNIASKSLDEWTKIIFPDNATARQEAARAYAVGTDWQIQSASDARDLLHSDYQFACTTTYDANMMVSVGIPTWRYLFNASLPGGRLAGHGSDVGFVFGSSQSTDANRILSRRIQGAWASFAKNPTAGPGWVRYGGSSTKTLGNLGGEGDRKSITLSDPQVVDFRCPVWTDAYDPNRPRS